LLQRSVLDYLEDCLSKGGSTAIQQPFSHSPLQTSRVMLLNGHPVRLLFTTGGVGGQDPIRQQVISGHFSHMGGDLRSLPLAQNPRPNFGRP